MVAYRAALSLCVIVLCSPGELAAARRIHSSGRSAHVSVVKAHQGSDISGPEKEAAGDAMGCKKNIMALSAATMMRIAGFFGPDCGIKQEHLNNEGVMSDAGTQAICSDSCQNNGAFATAAPDWASVQATCNDKASLQLLARAGQSIGIHATLQGAWSSCTKPEEEDTTPEEDVPEEVVPPKEDPARTPIAKPVHKRIKQTLLAISLNNVLQNGFGVVKCATLKEVWRQFDWNADGKLTVTGVKDVLNLVDTTEIEKNFNSMQTDERTQNPDYITFLDLAEQRMSVSDEFDCMLEWAQGK